MILWKVALCLTALASQVTAAPKQPPNILLIFTDDQSYKTVRCYPESFPWVKTPNIDALAADPEELTNLALRAEHRTTLEQLR